MKSIFVLLAIFSISAAYASDRIPELIHGSQTQISMVAIEGAAGSAMTLTATRVLEESDLKKKRKVSKKGKIVAGGGVVLMLDAFARFKKLQNEEDPGLLPSLSYVIDGSRYLLKETETIDKEEDKSRSIK